MTLGGRAFIGAILSAVPGWCQSKPRRLTEEDEWAEAYAMAKHIGRDHPKDGVVPNAEVAKRIAEAVATGLYGEEAMGERPYRARLRGDVWTVMGSLPTLALGGVAIIQISKQDGRILFSHHAQ
jgi:hypothetical protein